jgi:hypothetical protein
VSDIVAEAKSFGGRAKRTKTGWVVEKKTAIKQGDGSIHVIQRTEYEAAVWVDPQAVEAQRQRLDEAVRKHNAERGVLDQDSAARPDETSPPISDEARALRHASNRSDRLERDSQARKFARRPSHPGGRDGQKLDLSARAQVNEISKQRDQWASFDTSHPIEKMRARGSLSSDPLTADRRYRAARVWLQLYLTSQGLTSGGEWLQELVDGTSDPEASSIAKLHASNERIQFQRSELGSRDDVANARFGVLDSVCGYGRSISEVVKATNRQKKTVRAQLFFGLDAIGGYALWDKRMESVPSLYIESFKRTG